jgi:hypothetical protein
VTANGDAVPILRRSTLVRHSSPERAEIAGGRHARRAAPAAATFCLRERAAVLEQAVRIALHHQSLT